MVSYQASDYTEKELIEEILGLKDPTDGELEARIVQMIDKYDKEIEFTKVKGNKYISREMFKEKINKCQARLWNNGYECQCSNKIINNNLCKKHINMLEKYNTLRFGYINEPLPRNDLINNNSLKWKLNENI